jgi:3-phenylpropionate/trans-cinnamate dioxygenase ferredoxin reductase subunit
MSTATEQVVIVGGGQAGGECAMQLRKLGFAGPLTIITAEPFAPYRRPPLSKDYLTGACSRESLALLPPAKMEQLGIELRAGRRVVHIDRLNHEVQLDDGSRLSYQHLALTTGGTPRMPAIPGIEAGHVLALRTIEDADAIGRIATAGKHVTVIGGGFIGLEVAAVLTRRGVQVTVLEGLPRVLSRVVGPQVSTFFENLHRQAGVDLRCGVAVAALEGDPVQAVVLDDGSRIATDAVVVGIGLVPATELAEAAGLVVDNGIVVDEYARTTDAHIVAAGDCSNHPSALYHRRIRLESVQNAMDQGRIAAATIMGKLTPYRAVPWFWSDQYHIKLQIAGLSMGHDQTVLRGDPEQGAFALYYLRDGQLLAADAINRAQDFMFARKMIGSSVNPAQLEDESVSLQAMLKETHPAQDTP